MEMIQPFLEWLMANRDFVLLLQLIAAILGIIVASITLIPMLWSWLKRKFSGNNGAINNDVDKTDANRNDKDDDDTA